MKLRTISLTNFKQFERLVVACRDVNVLVGPNNAGKSTTLDALRVCSDVLRISRSRRPQLRTQDGYGVCASYQISPDSLSIGIMNVVRDYGDQDALIELTHENGNKMIVSLHPEKPVNAFLFVNGPIPSTSQQVNRCFPADLVIIPTLGPLEEEEPYYVDETVRRNTTTRRAHRNFRNIWVRRSNEEFAVFAELIAFSWPGVTVEKPSVVRRGGPFVDMYFTEDRRTREVAWSGFGFQIWMQMMTHIIRGK